MNYLQDNEYFDKITELKQKFYGNIDANYDDVEFRKHNENYSKINTKYVKTVKLEFTGLISYGRRLCVALPIINDNDKQYVYKNLRTNNNYDKVIKNCHLEVEGHARIDSTYGKVMDCIRKLYKLDDNIIPFYFNREHNFLPINENYKYILYFEFEGETLDTQNIDFENFELSIDIHEIENELDITHSFTSLQFIGNNIASNDVAIYNLCFNHLITYLLLHTKNCDLVSISLDFFDNSKNRMHLDIDINKCIKYNGIITIPFVKSLEYEEFRIHGINFSSAHTVQLNCEFANNTNESQIYIYGVHVQPIIINNEICTPKYAT